MIVLLCIHAKADHITGGEISYTYLGNSGGQYNYSVVVRMFMRCFSGRQFNNPTTISVFSRNSGARVADYAVQLSRSEVLNLNNTDPCITNPPAVCYEVGYYEFQVSLPASIEGYVLTAHVNFRIDGINNLVTNYDRIGATYVGEIPASSADDGAKNTSAHFTGEDLVIVCAENSFTYSFAAVDADGDKLRYSFCNAYKTTGQDGFGNNISPPPPPPYLSVPYGNGFTGTAPLGNLVKIDENTGIITGIAPKAGTYIVTVCVEEIRNGVVIATQHKDLQINIAPCSIAAAAMPEEYMLCGDTKTLTVKNNSTSSLIQSYNWNFFDHEGNNIFSSSAATPTFSFQDTGTYIIKLVINQNQQCSDSASAVAKVYPGFVPDFSVSGQCIAKPSAFTDATTSAYGETSAWKWNFGESGATDNLYDAQNVTHTYLSAGDKPVTLIVENSVGCRDTLSRVVQIFDKPPINLAFRDTLICPPDNVQLKATGSGVFTWSPIPFNANGGPSAPFVSPLSTTTYYVDLNDDGCTNRDSVTVKVVDHVTLNAMNDAVICEGDTVQLRLTTDALKFTWTPALTLDDPSAKNPYAKPAGNTTYSVTGYISSCFASDDVTINTVPYPVANAGADTSICFDTPVQMHATSDGSSFVWQPSSLLSNPQSLDPLAKPLTSTSFILFAYDNKGCPKPGTDTVFVHVEPQIVPFAGNDTTVVINQPLQMQASGGSIYQWTPSTGLSDPKIANPLVRFTASPAEGYYRYKVVVSNETGCADSAYVQVRVFSSGPEIYVPTAFTPNNDGRNDHFQVVGAGIRSIQAFRIYNRWGQLVYDSPIIHSIGWDGLYGGKPQPPDTYVWFVQATDYLGKSFVKKGTVVLIR
jgi:gliding motility-associated-like protein